MEIGGDLHKQTQHERPFHCRQNTSSRALREQKKRVLGEEMVFGGEAKAQHAPGGCRWVGRDMANISPKFGVVRLSVRCGGQVDVKVTQNRNWTK